MLIQTIIILSMYNHAGHLFSSYKSLHAKETTTRMRSWIHIKYEQPSQYSSTLLTNEMQLLY